MAENLIVAERVELGRSGGVIINPALPEIGASRRCGIYFELRGIQARQVQVWLIGPDQAWLLEDELVEPPSPWEAVGIEIDLRGHRKGSYTVEVLDGEEAIHRDFEF